MKNISAYSSISAYRMDCVDFLKECLKQYMLKLLDNESESRPMQNPEDTLSQQEISQFLQKRTSEQFHASLGDYYQSIIRKAEYSMKEGVFLPLEYLSRVFCLDASEHFLVTILAAAQWESHFTTVLSDIYHNRNRKSFDLELVEALYSMVFPGEELDYSVFSQSQKLRQYFIMLSEDTYGYYKKGELRLQSRILSFLFEENLEEKELTSLMQIYFPHEQREEILSEEKPWQKILEMLTARNKEATLFYLYGPAGIGKKLNLKYVAGELNKALLFFDLELLIKEVSAFDKLFTAILFQVIAKQGLLCICSRDESLTEHPAAIEVLNKIFLEAGKILPVTFFLSDCGRRVKLSPELNYVVPIELPVPSAVESHRFWMEISKQYPMAGEIDWALISHKYPMTPGPVKELLQEAYRNMLWNGRQQIMESDLMKVYSEHMHPDLGKNALRVPRMYLWEDLILPEHQKGLLRTACNQIQYKYKVYSEWGFDETMAYGTGLSIVFSGPPGTGKTMAAQVIANEMVMDLFKINLSCVVSKYIGETEQNLERIFEAARASQCILFFDEADVLFGKRTEVKDSNDKYSNMEAAYLLQKMEEYPGVAILATNLIQNIDEAFKRRMKFIIEFPFPDRNDRRKLWAKAFPPRLPVSHDLDLDFLAERFELSGSNIKNVVVNAAFLAAAGEEQVSMSHLLRSVANEYAKSGKKLSKEELGEYFMYL